MGPKHGPARGAAVFGTAISKNAKHFNHKGLRFESLRSWSHDHGLSQGTRRSGQVLGSLLIAVAGLAPSSSAAGASTSSPPYVRFGTTLTDTTLGTGTEIDTVDMLSSSLGYGVASPSNAHRGWFYLVLTRDEGHSWHVRAALPLPSFVGTYGVDAEPKISFVTPQIGYASERDGPLYVTDDAGASWAKMSIPGVRPTYVTFGGVISVVSDVCRSAVPAFGPLLCPSDLTRYRVGATTPLGTAHIPALGPAGKWRAATALTGLTPQSVVVVEGGEEGKRSSLLATTNGGVTWTLLSDPCEDLNVDQLLSANPHRWLLYCFLDGGMSQGTSELWDSTSNGSAWAPLARDGESGSDVGHIGDVANTIETDASGSILLGAMGGAAGGLEDSVDGGATWNRVPIQTNIYGGSLEYLSTFGRSGAIFGIQTGPQFLTLNGTTWRELPSLPAGLYHGLSICTTRRGTQVGLNPTVTGIPASTIDFPIVFTNRGNSACYLNGFPIVQPVAGAQRRALGQPAYAEQVGTRGGFVILRPHGGTASVVFERESARGYPKSYCVPRFMGGITIRFARPSTFFIAIPRGKVCSGVSTVNAGGVAPGLISWL